MEDNDEIVNGLNFEIINCCVAKENRGTPSGTTFYRSNARRRWWKF